MARIKTSWKIYVYIVIFLILGYLGSRLLNLTKLPIFTDEAIYIRWSQIGSRDANWRFISLVDGKQPLFTWIMMVFLRLIHDPLTAGRLVSVVAGFGSAIGIWFLSFELFKSKKVSFITTFLYLVSPFSLVYDRLALYDSLVAMFSIWNLYIAVQLARRPRLDTALILGMTLGGGMLNKTSGFLSLYLLPMTVLLFDWQKKERTKRFLRWIWFVIVAALVSQAMYAVLRLSPLYAMIGQKDLVFIYSIREWFHHPLKFLIGNISGLFDWITSYLTWPIFILSLIPLVWIHRDYKEKLLLYGWWFAPFVALASFGRVLYPRFILFMTMPLLITAALTVAWIINKFGKSTIGIALFIVIFIPSLYMDYYVIMDPLYAPLPFSDKSQLIDDWPSGWGVAEINALLTNESKHSKVSIYTEGTFGLLPYAIEMYQVDNPRVSVHGVWPMPPEPSAQMVADAIDHPTYIVFNQTQVAPPWPLQFIAMYQKGNRQDVQMRVFRLAEKKKTPAHTP